MRLKGEFTIEKSNYGNAGEHLNDKYPSINNKPVDGLINLLNAHGANISCEDSEKEVSYKIREETKQTTVPLTIHWDISNVQRYFLRGEDGLEIELNDYHSDPPSRMLDGESFTFIRGVNCEIAVGIACSASVSVPGKSESLNTYAELIKDFYKLKEGQPSL